jgi:hypothetical protein
MKTPIRFQSRLLIRRSYKPARIFRGARGFTFRPASRAGLGIATANSLTPPLPGADETIAKSE